jgi:hypothetical protein
MMRRDIRRQGAGGVPDILSYSKFPLNLLRCVIICLLVQTGKALVDCLAPLHAATEKENHYRMDWLVKHGAGERDSVNPTLVPWDAVVEGLGGGSTRGEGGEEDVTNTVTRKEVWMTQHDTYSSLRPKPQPSSLRIATSFDENDGRDWVGRHQRADVPPQAHAAYAGENPDQMFRLISPAYQPR